MTIVRKVRNKLHSSFAQVANRCFEWYMRGRLENRDFTILCSNCIGGIIYHRLGLQFLSPTVNLGMHQRDYLKLAEKTREYMQAELEFLKDADYPTARLKDITVYFNHSASAEEARADWDRRKERIRYDNLFIILENNA